MTGTAVSPRPLRIVDAPAMDACPTADELVGFAEGQLQAERRDAIAQHLDRCPNCAFDAAEAARMIEGDDAWATHLTVTAGQVPRAMWLQPDPALPRGTVIGKYLVVQRIGVGGLGQVYLGYDPELDRRVALKVLKGKRGTRWASDRDGLRERLMTEARALARVSHPNVVHVYDVGEFGEHLFIAMELVEGSTLRQWLTQRRRGWEEIRDLFLAAGEGLAAAHGVGLVHRDFKPDNVIIGNDGRVRVLDFGLARALEVPHEGPGRDASAIGPAGLRKEVVARAVGTPAYMAPEQFSGDSLDARLDQFAFAVSLFEAVYGARPFFGRTMRELAVAATLGRVRRPRSTGGVPQWLDRVISRGLAARPAARFSNMRQMLAALQHDRRKHRLHYALLTLLVAVCVAIGFGVWGWASRDAPVDHTPRIEELTAKARAAAGDGHFVYPARGAADPVTAYHAVVELEALGALGSELGARRAQELRTEFGDDLLALGDQFWSEDGGAPFAADYYAAALLFEPELDRARERALASRGELAALQTQARDGDFTPADLVVGESLAALAQPDPVERRRRIGALYEEEVLPLSTATRLETVLGEIPVRTPKVRRAVEPRPPAVPVAESAQAASAPPVPSRSPAAAGTEVRAGRAALARGQVGAAAQHFHRALKADRRSVDALLGLAEVEFQKGGYSRAVEFANRAARAEPGNVRAHTIAGNAYYRMLRYVEALTAYRKAADRGHGPAKRRVEKIERMLGNKEKGKR